MDVKIDKVIDYGTHDSERVLFNVVADCDLGRYMVADSTFNKEDVISNKLRHTYWFPDGNVKKGDKVVLYTKEGKNTKTDISGGSNKLHTFYWNLKSSVWNNTGDAAVLLQLATWEFKKVK